MCLGCLALIAFFTESNIIVSEEEGMVAVCVDTSFQTIGGVVFDLQSRDGNATGKIVQSTMQTTINHK